MLKQSHKRRKIVFLNVDHCDLEHKHTANKVNKQTHHTSTENHSTEL